MPNFVRRMPCCLTSRAMAVSFLRRSTGAAHKPSPRGEAAELCSPDAVEASRLPPVPSGACLTSSLVCFCITCQAFFLSAEKPASAPCAAPASRTNGRHSAPSRKSAPRRSPANRPAPRRSPANRPAPRRSPASRPAPHRSPASRPAPRRSPASRPAPRRSPASLPRTGPIPRRGRFSTEFSTFLPVSHSGFLSPWLSWRETASDLLSRGFFLQRKTRYGMVRYCTVRLGTVPRDVASASRVTNPPERPPSAPCRAAGGRHRKPLRRLCFSLLNLHYVNRFQPSVSNSGKWAISARQNGTKNFLSAFFAQILRFSLQISARKEPPFRAALRHFEPCFSARVTPG